MTQPAPVPQDDVAIRMIGVNKWYGDFHVLRDINLDVAARREDRHVRARRARANRR